MIFKIILAGSLGILGLSQAYMWANDTTFSQEKDKVVNKIDTYVTEKKNEAVNSTKQAVRNGFDSSLNKLGMKTSESQKDTVSQESAKFNWHYQLNFKYDTAGSPASFSQEKMLAMIKQASDVWEMSCGVSFKMIGPISSDYIATDGKGTSGKDFGIIRWSEMAQDTLGQAHLGGVKGPVDDFILDLNDSLFTDSNGKINEESLKAVAVHELGHVIGLHHSRIAQSVMHSSQRTFNTLLNNGDKEKCLEIVSQWDKNPANKKFNQKI